MKSTALFALFVIFTVHYVSAEPLANPAPEPWLGNEAKEYCEQYAGKLTAEQVCRNISNLIVGKLKGGCETGVDTICSVAVGFTKQCKNWIDKTVCPELYSGDEDLPGKARPWLENKIESACVDEVSPYVSKKDKVCEKVQEAVSVNCNKIVVEVCDKMLGSDEPSSKALLKKLKKIQKRNKSSKKGHKKSAKKSLLSKPCSWDITKTVIYQLCR